MVLNAKLMAKNRNVSYVQNVGESLYTYNRVDKE